MKNAIPKKAKQKKWHSRFIKSLQLKFIFSKKATKIDEIFTVDLTVTTYFQVDVEDNFCGLLLKYSTIFLQTQLRLDHILNYRSLPNGT